MKSMYEGSTNFSREQLVFAVEAVMAGAMDRIEAFLPPTISYEDYEAHKVECDNMVHGAKCVVSITLPILWAQLNNDGMGIGEFRGYDQFEKMVDDYVAEVTNPKAPNNVPVPRFRNVAEQFVDYEFAEYLGRRKLQPGERRAQVLYNAGFEAEVIIGPDEDPEDVASDINIPEDEISRYSRDSFDIIRITAEDGTVLFPEQDEDDED